MERRAGYAVKPAPASASAGRRILMNAVRATGNRKASFPERFAGKEASL
jgi:hypothetical protein